MSDQNVLAVIQRLEAWLAEEPFSPDPEYIAGWHQEFMQAVQNAEKGPTWEAIVARAHELSRLLDRKVGVLLSEQERLKKEMGLQAHGERALKAYRP